MLRKGTKKYKDSLQCRELDKTRKDHEGKAIIEQWKTAAVDHGHYDGKVVEM